MYSTYTFRLLRAGASRLAYFKEASMTAEAIGDEADAVKLAAKSRSGMAAGQARDLPLPPG